MLQKPQMESKIRQRRISVSPPACVGFFRNLFYFIHVINFLFFFKKLFPEYNFFSTVQHGDPVTHKVHILFSHISMLHHK